MKTQTTTSSTRYRKIVRFIGIAAFCFFAFCAVSVFFRQRDFIQKRADFDARKSYLLTIIKASEISGSFSNTANTEFRITDRESLNGRMNTELWGGKVLVLKNVEYTGAIVSQDYFNLFSSNSSRLGEMRKLGFRIILFSSGSEEWKYKL